MVKFAEREEKNTAHDSRKSSDTNKETDGDLTLSKAAFLRLKLKRIASHAMLWFAPATAVLALVFAVVAVTGSQSSEAQLSAASARIDSLNASLSVSKSELDKLKAALAQEKILQEDRMTKIIQNVNQLQVVMHISPTLEEELHQPPSATPPAASAATTPEKNHTDKH